MSRSAADTTKRLESKYSREVQQASTSMSGRMAALTAKVKKSFQDRREDAPAPAAAVAAAPATATDTYAIAGDSDSDEDEDLTPEERALRAEQRRQRKEREEAETARAMLALELAGLAPGVDYDLTKWDGTARVCVGLARSCLPVGVCVCRSRACTPCDAARSSRARSSTRGRCRRASFSLATLPCPRTGYLCWRPTIRSFATPLCAATTT